MRQPRVCQECGLVGSRDRRARLRPDGRVLCAPCRLATDRVPETATCTGCGETKAGSEFYAHGTRGGLSGLRCKDCTLDALRLRKYGITAEEVARRAEEQNGRCAICSEVKKLGVDHCHTGGEVRGLLCRECNAGLGMFADSPDRLLAAAAYLLTSRDLLVEVATHG